MGPVFFCIVCWVKTYIPKNLYSIERIFRAAGHELYLVGGAVRNIVLGRPPEDWDLASDAQPQTIMKLFHHVIPTGIQHGTVTIRFKGENYEVTTYRIDGSYSDSRRPDSVEYTSNIYEDLKRRDFTINAMAYNLRTHQLLDPHGGKQDLKSGIIRTVGDPLLRFSEDGLRIIRGIRFASALNFSIEDETFIGMRSRLDFINQVSVERIRDEFNKILFSPRPSRGLAVAEELGVLELFLPELHGCRNFSQDSMPGSRDLFDHLLCCCDYAPVHSLEIRFAALLHDIGKPGTQSETPGGEISYPGHEKRSAEMASIICNRLKYPRAFEKKVHHLIVHHMFQVRGEDSDKSIRRFMSRVGRDSILDLLDLKTADIAGKSGPFHDQRQDGSPLQPPVVSWLNEMRKRVGTLLQEQSALSIADLDINGNILHENAGIPKSREMKQVLEYLLEAVLDDPSMNNRGQLLTLAANYYMERIMPLKEDN